MKSSQSPTRDWTIRSGTWQRSQTTVFSMPRGDTCHLPWRLSSLRSHFSIENYHSFGFISMLSPKVLRLWQTKGNINMSYIYLCVYIIYILTAKQYFVFFIFILIFIFIFLFYLFFIWFKWLSELAVRLLRRRCVTVSQVRAPY